MPNNFTRHGISHLSPSSVNMFAEDPAAWVAKYLLKRKFTFSPAARGGVIVEDAVVAILEGKDLNAVIDGTLKEYRKMTVFDNSDKAQKWADSMENMICQAVNELRPYGKPEFEVDGEQKKIGITCNMGDYVMPITGFTDFHYPQHNLVVDLKCTQRAPSAMSNAHLRQAAIYKQAMGADVKFLYVTGKKTQWFEIGDTADTLAEFKAIVSRMNNLLSLDVDTIVRTVPVVDSFYFTDDMAMRKEIYGY